MKKSSVQIRHNKLVYVCWGVVTLALIFWLVQAQAERTLKQDLEEVGLFFIETPLSVQSVDLGLFTSQVKSIAIPNTTIRNTEVSSKSIELDELQIQMPLFNILQHPIVINKIHLSGLTIYWNGITGQNIQFLIQQLNKSLPRKSRRWKRRHKDTTNEEHTIQVENVVVEDITIQTQFKSNTKEFRIPELVLYDVTGNSEGIIRQILEQTRSSFQKVRTDDVQDANDIDTIGEPN
jgi:hypothetical protein